MDGWIDRYIVADWKIEWPFGNRRGIRKNHVLTYPVKKFSFWTLFRLENLEWVTDILRNTVPVSQNGSGTQNIEWVLAHSWRTADFQKKIAQNSKITCHSKFGSQVLFFVEGSPKAFEHDFFEHLLSFFKVISTPFSSRFSSILHPFCTNAIFNIHPLSSVLHPCWATCGRTWAHVGQLGV